MRAAHLIPCAHMGSSKLESALARAQNDVPECVASGCVDMSTGLLVGIKTTSTHPSDVLDLVAAATADMFQGPNVSTIEQLFRQSRGHAEDGAHYLKEIFATSTNLLHIFLRLPRRPDHAVVFVCRISANLGMAAAKAKLALPPIEAAL